jgi:EmrB/QacA subfamily drug resistance transporter
MGVRTEHRLGLALTVIAAAQLMLVLDGTIMNVALPAVQRELDLAPAELSWVVNAYALAFGGLLLVGGRAGDLFGWRRVFRIGLVVFTVASLIGGLAPTKEVLIGARVLQGIGAAIAAPTALSLLATTFPAGPERNRALGVYGTMGGLGSVVGLLLGGALTSYVDWRWVLFVNVPIALAVLAGTGALVAGERERGRVDVVGAVTATGGLGSLVYAITTGSLTFLAVAAVSLAGFLVVQYRSPVAMMPPRVLRSRVRAGANVALLLIGAGMFATFYFLTLYMQQVRGYGALRTGLAYLPFAVGMGLSSGALGPRVLARASVRTVAVSGLAMAAAGMTWFATLTPTSGYFAVLAPAMLLAGVGLGLAFIATTIAGVDGVAPADTGIAAGLVNTTQQVGGALGLAGLAVVAAAASSPVAGYTAAFAVGAGLYVAALAVSAFTLP